MFLVRSGLWFSFWALEVPEPRLRKRPLSLLIWPFPHSRFGHFQCPKRKSKTTSHFSVWEGSLLQNPQQWIYLDGIWKKYHSGVVTTTRALHCGAKRYTCLSYFFCLRIGHFSVIFKKSSLPAGKLFCCPSRWVILWLYRANTSKPRPAIHYCTFDDCSF